MTTVAADKDHTPVVVHCRDLCKKFGSSTAVTDLSFDIRPRTCFGLLGPNGAGKTTTLRMLLGQSPRSGGILEVFGKDINDGRRQIRQCTGIVPQADNLDPDFTVKENLSMYGSYFRLNPKVLNERIPGLLEMVELLPRANHRINTLSGGMKRRLTLARALVNDPKLVIADEPSVGLDPNQRDRVLAALKAIALEGKAVMLITHDLRHALTIADRVSVIRQGQALETAPAQAFQGQGEQLMSCYARTLWQALPDNAFSTHPFHPTHQEPALA